MAGRILLKRFEIVNSNAVYTFNPTFGGTITARLWGGGGGGGSGDGSASGGSGSPGLYNTLTFDFNKGDTIEVAIGSGGQPGISGRPQKGGAGGAGRINVDGISSHSFNGGKGGDGPVSGAGGGGGGATAVLVNGQLLVVAGGGGGGGGAGSKTSPNGKSASISYNAMLNEGSIQVQSSNFNATRDPKTVYIDVNGTHVLYGFTRGHTLAVFNPTTLALESKQTFDTYGTQNSTALKNALTAVANGKIVAIGSFDACTLDQATRTLLNSQFGGTRSEIWSKTIGSKLPRTSHVFISVKNGGVTAIEEISAASDSSGIISGTFNTTIITPTDYRGQNGQSRNSDGGTGGAGGGGYPGGLGGKSNAGDSGAEAGQTGGNFPAGSATTGTDDPYYDSSYGMGGSPSASGKNGYAILEIVPRVEYVSGSAVKVAGTWRQVSKGYVKIDGTWRQIDATYVKQNGSWRKIVSSGDQNSVVATGSTNNYGQIQRSYS